VKRVERVIAYVDGHNLYHGLRARRWKWFYWLDIQAMVGHLLKPNQVLKTTKYFTTRVKKPEDKRKRQEVFLEALETLSNFEIYYGRFLADTVRCHKCGHTYETHHEKMTDVNIAVELMSDVFRDRFDVALLVSGDGDLVGPVEAVRRLFVDKRVVVAFPPRRVSKALKRTANASTHISRKVLSSSVFPGEIVKPDGRILRRPSEWR